MKKFGIESYGAPLEGDLKNGGPSGKNEGLPGIELVLASLLTRVPTFASSFGRVLTTERSSGHW